MTNITITHWHDEIKLSAGFGWVEYFIAIDFSRFYSKLQRVVGSRQHQFYYCATLLIHCVAECEMLKH